MSTASAYYILVALGSSPHPDESGPLDGPPGRHLEAPELLRRGQARRGGLLAPHPDEAGAAAPHPDETGALPQLVSQAIPGNRFRFLILYAD